MSVLCPSCGLPAEAITVAFGDSPMTLIGCPCARERPYVLNLPIVLMTENHDPGDEDVQR